MTTQRSPRARQIVTTARTLIEQEGVDTLTMRRLADELDIQAPSLYKHFPDKSAIVNAVYVEHLQELYDQLADALRADDPHQHPLVRLTEAYRQFAMGNRQMYIFGYTLPYPREEAPNLLRNIRLTWFKATGDSDLAISAYAFVRGMVILEIFGRYPTGADPIDAYELGLDAFIEKAERIAAQRAAGETVLRMSVLGT